MPITISAVTQIRMPPMVGVPLFLRWSFWKIVAALPSDAVSRICLPILFFSKKIIKGFAASRAIMKVKPKDPKMRMRWRTVSVMGKGIRVKTRRLETRRVVFCFAKRL